MSAISSSLMSVDILDDIPSPVEQIVAMNITHDSVILHWEPPLISNGFIIGYSIYANDIPVSGNYNFEHVGLLLSPMNTT